MKQDTAARRRREQFITDTLGLALDALGVTDRRIVSGGSPNGADHCEAVAVLDGTEWELEGPIMADGFGVLWSDRYDNGPATKLPDVSTAWRDRMLQARSVNSCDTLTPDDALRILRLGLAAQDD